MRNRDYCRHCWPGWHTVRGLLKSAIILAVAAMMVISMPAWSNSNPTGQGKAEAPQKEASNGNPVASTKGVSKTASHSVGASMGSRQRKASDSLLPKPVPFVVASEDGFLIHSTVYYPGGKTKRLPIVMLLHDLNGTQKDWQPWIPALIDKGYAVITMDLRGHGLSAARGKNPKKKPKRFTSWRLMSSKEWQEAPSDVIEVLRYTAAHPEQYPRLNSKKIAIIGGSVGANVAMLAGQRYQHRILGLGLLSARLNYKGLEISVGAVYYPGSVFIAASQSDPQTFESAKRLFQLSQGQKSIRLFKDAGQGTELLTGYPPLLDDLTNWLDKVFRKQ
ncbi:MAG: alpha/beta fold hydrolase [Vampirovibrionales bacterium]|nr:alpha/beta fold hydrolase [Vampirovibrionales bacterium]